MPIQSLEEMHRHMEKTLAICREELARLRVGRASSAMVEDVQVNYYGARTPLKHLAQISAPEANLIVVRPFDTSQIAAIEKAILEANLGFNPVSDKETVHITVPKLSQERRQEMVRLIKEKSEESKVALRSNRRHFREEIEQRQDRGEISEDDLHRALEEMDKTTNEYVKQIDQLMKEKEKQITTI